MRSGGQAEGKRASRSMSEEGRHTKSGTRNKLRPSMERKRMHRRFFSSLLLFTFGNRTVYLFVLFSCTNHSIQKIKRQYSFSSHAWMQCGKCSIVDSAVNARLSFTRGSVPESIGLIQDIEQMARHLEKWLTDHYHVQASAKDPHHAW
jgi:hypothetical protein